MKKITSLILITLFLMNVKAQSHAKFSYQAVIRDANEALISNQNLGIQISVLQGSVSGTAVYTESHTSATNINGLVSLEIGTGVVVLGNFSNIDWANGPYFIKTETDLTGGINYTITGVSEMLSVPYALYAENVANSDDADADPNNELQDLSFNQATGELTISNGNTVILPATSGGDNWGSQIVVSGATLSGEGTVTNPLEVVGDLTDDQTLTLLNDDLSISGGNSVDLSQYQNTDAQTLGLTTNTLSISNGNSVDLSSYLDNTDAQTLGLTTNTLSISNGNNVDLSSYLDNTDAQTLALTNDTMLNISNGNNLNLAPIRIWQKNNSNEPYSLDGVAIGGNCADCADAKLMVFRNTSGNNFKSAIRATILGTDSSSLGVFGRSLGTSPLGNNYGIYGLGANAANNYGVSGEAFGATGTTRAVGISGSNISSQSNINVGAEGVVTDGQGNFNISVLGAINGNTNGNAYSIYAENTAVATGSSFAIYATNSVDDALAYKTGVYATADGSNENYSIDGTYSGTSTTNIGYGTTGWAYGQGPTNYAVYGYTDPTTTPGVDYAGFFAGDVTVMGTFSNPSDASLKTGIVGMNGALASLALINPVKYFFKKDIIQKIKTPSVEQFGFTAQNIKDVFPNLVKKEVAPVHIIKEVEDLNGNSVQVKEQSESIEFNSVNYIGLIPVLTQAIKEQQSIIENLQLQINELKNEIGQ